MGDDFPRGPGQAAVHLRPRRVLPGALGGGRLRLPPAAAAGGPLRADHAARGGGVPRGGQARLRHRAGQLRGAPAHRRAGAGRRPRQGPQPLLPLRAAQRPGGGGRADVPGRAGRRRRLPPRHLPPHRRRQPHGQRTGAVQGHAAGCAKKKPTSPTSPRSSRRSTAFTRRSGARWSSSATTCRTATRS